MDSDRQLLRQFTQHNSQQAFAALTARYLSLVYSTCRRELDDASLAEDVTQAVFLILARKAPTLRREVVLSGWLFQTARFAARNARLQEARRKATEGKAADTLREQQMNTEDAAWTEVEPLLNQSLAALRDGERECVLLRFFQGMTFAEAGAVLGVSEEAARKRFSRALDKMRQIFVKNGVIVPAAALTVLLTAHAAKAAPAGLAPAIAQSTSGVLAGHINAGLTGPHVYKLSEGVLKAMKIAQVKVAVGITAAVVGVSIYAVTQVIGQPAAMPGHLLQQVPGKTVTATQIAERCRAAYADLKTYQVTATVTTHYVTVADGQTSASHTSATIQFVRPGKIHAEGTDMDGYAYAYVSDGTETAETNRSINGAWRRDKNPEMAVASVTGIAAGAATTIPALLLNANMGTPLVLSLSGDLVDPEVREDAIGGHLCYILTAHSVSITQSTTQSLWIDKKTFLVRRYISDFDNVARTFFIGGRKQTIPAMNSHSEENFTNERLNETILDSAFALPPVQ